LPVEAVVLGAGAAVETGGALVAGAAVVAGGALVEAGGGAALVVGGADVWVGVGLELLQETTSNVLISRMAARIGNNFFMISSSLWNTHPLYFSQNELLFKFKGFFQIIP
jgi:hypothetical protein